MNRSMAVCCKTQQLNLMVEVAGTSMLSHDLLWMLKGTVCMSIASVPFASLDCHEAKVLRDRISDLYI